MSDGSYAGPSLDLPTPERALAISAHPDDSEFGCGGTLAKWAADGCEVSILVCTDGSKGTWDAHADVDLLVATRQIEQRAALSALGSDGTVGFCGWVDGELDSDLARRSLVAHWIRRLRPTVVLGHDPWKRYRLHPDHRHAGQLTIDGVVAARDPHFYPEHGLGPHRPDHLLLFEAETPDHYENVMGWLPAKIAALEAHESQFESTMFIDPDDAGEQRAAFHRRLTDEVREFGAQTGLEQAEAFKRLSRL